jgi:hypothetical protein
LDLSSFCDFGHFQKAVLLPSSWCSRILLHVHVLQSFHVEWFWQLQDAGLLACTSLLNAVFVALAQLAVSVGLDVYYQVTAKRVNCHLKDIESLSFWWVKPSCWLFCWTHRRYPCTSMAQLDHFESSKVWQRVLGKSLPRRIIHSIDLVRNLHLFLVSVQPTTWFGFRLAQILFLWQ